MNVLITIELLKERKEEVEKLPCSFIWSSRKDVTKEEVEWADVILGQLPLDLLPYAKNLKYLHLMFAGSDNYAFNPYIQNKVILTNSSGCYSHGISEYLVAMTLHFFKNINLYDRNMPNHLYKEMGESRTILNSRFVIIGAGSIGSEFAKKIKALGGYTIGIKRTPSEKPDYFDELYTNERLDEVLPRADVVAMCLPQNDSTRKMMDKDRLNLLKKDAVLLNVGRGSAIDTEALIPLLKEKKISAGLDVHEIEPLPETNELWDLDNVLILPHVTGKENLKYTRERLADLAIENLTNYISNKPLKNIVDFSTGYRKSTI